MTPTIHFFCICPFIWGENLKTMPTHLSHLHIFDHCVLCVSERTLCLSTVLHLVNFLSGIVLSTNFKILRNVGYKLFWTIKSLQLKWVLAHTKYHTKPYKNWQIVALCSGRVQSRRCRGDHISKGSSIFSRECRVVEFLFHYTRIGHHLHKHVGSKNDVSCKGYQAKGDGKQQGEGVGS